MTIRISTLQPTRGKCRPGFWRLTLLVTLVGLVFSVLLQAIAPTFPPAGSALRSPGLWLPPAPDASHGIAVDSAAGGPRVAPPQVHVDPVAGVLTLRGGDAQDHLYLAVEDGALRLRAANATARHPGPLPAVDPARLRRVVVVGPAALTLGALPLNPALTLQSNGPLILAAPLAIDGALRVDAARITVAAPLRAEALDLAAGGVLDLAAGAQLSATGAATLRADALLLTGDLEAATATLAARAIIQAGTVRAPAIVVRTSESYQATTTARLDAAGETGGSILLDVGRAGQLFTSGTIVATGATEWGGQIDLLGDTLVLVAATVDASGWAGGGQIRVGGDVQGRNPSVPNATAVTLAGGTALLADATNHGDGGRIIVWSDGVTEAAGVVRAQGGPAGGDGGFVELSGKSDLRAGVAPDVSAPAGQAGVVLIDPKNLTIAADGALPQFSLRNPTPGAGDQFGARVQALEANRTVVVTDPGDDTVAPDAGAVYLFDGLTGALRSTLTGSSAGDQIGGSSGAVLSNGNYVISSPLWDNGPTADAGAVTWGSGASGVSGTVSASNSLVGSRTADRVGGGTENGSAIGGVTALNNGNYVVRSPDWNNGAATRAGAVTWGSGSSGISGVVSVANSLVGSSADDRVGFGRFLRNDVTVLSNGNFVVSSPTWDNGLTPDAGAVTWGSGTSGVSGTISAANSLVGGSANDIVGGGGVTTLGNGNYVASSPFWNNGAATRAGAVSWGNGASGTRGIVSASNSLVGSSTDDRVGFGNFRSDGVTALSKGNYVVRSPRWNNGARADAGAVTWGSDSSGVSGVISAANSLVGNSVSDLVGSGGVTVLSTGNYVVGSPLWDFRARFDVGAVTWGSGTSGVSGLVSADNSLTGTDVSDLVGLAGVTALSNGNYVVSSPEWDNEAATNVGAVTWGSGTSGVRGFVTLANSLVGSTANDMVGGGTDPTSAIGGVTALSNGNYVVSSPDWNNGAAARAGAVTWRSGAGGAGGVVSLANSLVGSSAENRVGLGSFGTRGVTALSNGNYVVNSPEWDNGLTTDAGAVTWGSGAGGVSGIVWFSNSLVGRRTDDRVGSGGVTALSNGNYVVNSPSWDNGPTLEAGAVSWGSGASGVSGEVSAANSLVGNRAGDAVGFDGIRPLSTGDYLVSSSFWDNGLTPDAGAVSWGSGASGVSGTITAANSLLDTGPAAVTEDVANRSFLSYTPADGGQVRVGFTEAAQLTYARGSAESLSVTPELLARTLGGGAALTLQASNDLAFSAPLAVANPAGPGGALTLHAGRSILLTASLATDDAPLTLIANDSLAGGVVDAQRDPGDAQVQMASGTTIDAGGAAVLVELRDGAGKTHAGRNAAELTGVIGLLTVQGAPLAPGGAQVGATVVTGGLTLAGGLAVTIGGAGSGQLDRVEVTGLVSLAGPLTIGSSGYTPATGDTLLLLSNDGGDGVRGTFAGLPEGALVPVGGGAMAISYVGGDGNDVTLTTGHGTGQGPIKLYLPVVAR